MSVTSGYESISCFFWHCCNAMWKVKVSLVCKAYWLFFQRRLHSWNSYDDVFCIIFWCPLCFGETKHWFL